MSGAAGISKREKDQSKAMHHSDVLHKRAPLGEFFSIHTKFAMRRVHPIHVFSIDGDANG